LLLAADLIFYVGERLRVHVGLKLLQNSQKQVFLAFLFGDGRLRHGRNTLGNGNNHTLGLHSAAKGAAGTN